MGAIVSVYVLCKRVGFVATMQTRIDIRRFHGSDRSIEGHQVGHNSATKWFEG
jgi:hypothetical protein